MNGRDKYQVHPQVTPYQMWVLEELVEYLAPNRTAAASAVLTLWIEQNSEYLRERGITLERYRREKRMSDKKALVDAVKKRVAPKVEDLVQEAMNEVMDEVDNEGDTDEPGASASVTDIHGR